MRPNGRQDDNIKTDVSWDVKNRAGFIYLRNRSSYRLCSFNGWEAPDCNSVKNASTVSVTCYLQATITMLLGLASGLSVGGIMARSSGTVVASILCIFALQSVERKISTAHSLGDGDACRRGQTPGSLRNVNPLLSTDARIPYQRDGGVKNPGSFVTHTDVICSNRILGIDFSVLSSAVLLLMTCVGKRHNFIA
jgi:hypothetical protein